MKEKGEVEGIKEVSEWVKGATEGERRESRVDGVGKAEGEQ